MGPINSNLSEIYSNNFSRNMFDYVSRSIAEMKKKKENVKNWFLLAINFVIAAFKVVGYGNKVNAKVKMF